MKKRYIWIACLLLIAALAIPVFAAAEVTLSASKNAAYRAEEITVTVSVSAVEGCKKGGIELSYDAGVFELVSGNWLLENTALKDFSVSTKDGVFAYSDAAAISGEIFQFTLRVREDAAFGDSSVTAAVSLGSESIQKTVSVKVACNHSYGNWEKADDNSHKRTCSVCGNVETAAHNWDAGSVTTKPSCTTEGIKTYTCTGCGATKTETVAKADHTWDAGTVTTAATCTAEGVKTFACASCQETKTQTIAKLDHAYDNACDTTCNYDCGTTRQITHSYRNKWSSDAKNHWHACSVCGAQKDLEAHTPGAEATEWSAQTCTDCGYVIKGALGHTHDYSQTYVTDEVGHWYACSGCDELLSYADHSYDNDCDADCNVCGYTRQVTHSFTEVWVSDETQHWHECAVCYAKGDAAEHTFAAEAADGSYCTVCNYMLTSGPSHTHVFEGSWSGDGNGHWQVCSCGEKSEVSAHTWDEGVVTREPTQTVAGVKTHTCTVCGEQKQETIASLSGENDPQDGDQSKEGIPAYVVFTVIGVVLVAAALFVVIGILVAKIKASRKED